MTEFVLHLDKAEHAGRAQAGGKGHTLARLHRAGFAVPPGFIVTADAYRTTTANNGLDTLIANALADDDPAAASERIAASFEEAKMPPAIAAAIHDAYRALGGGLVAVRSSALAEDGQATSFAGQHETFLDISGNDALLTAVRRCWASLWSERALAYRHRLDHKASEATMAVVVQHMAPAAQSGVAFTLDPVSGCRDVIIVEAIAGKGEALVSGQVAPHRYVVPRENTSPQSGDTLLDSVGLATVVRLAQEVQAWAGEPQDIEWALDAGGHIHLLQARPVTVARDATNEAHVTHWTRDNVGEVLPDPVTPLSWSILDPLSNLSFARVLRRLGIQDYPAAGMFGRFYGRVYFNQTLFQTMMSRFYPSHTGWRAAPRLALTAWRALRLARRIPGESKKTISDTQRQHQAETHSGPRDQLTIWRRLGAAAMEVHLAVSVIGELLYQTLDKLLERWGDGMTSAAALTSGLTGVRSAEAGQALAVLAQQIGQDDSLCTLVLSTHPQALPARLGESEQGRALWAKVEAFLTEHGHSAVQEFELAAPRWRDDPTIILNALQAQVRVAGEKPVPNPSATRRAAVARIKERLIWPKRWLFCRLLQQTQTFVLTRENQKYHFVMAHSHLRDLYLALADQLVAAGRLTDQNDIFFLTSDEVETLLDGELSPDEGKRRVAQRRRAWKTHQQTTPPFALHQQPDGRLHTAALPVSPGDDDELLLRGFAASPGAYTGRARVMLTPTDGVGLEPGEILVASATSPGWAPLFLAAGALVTEIGGTLSHGAIIAREYGLPAVLNVTDATRRIRTGQLVHVDGSQGTIQLLEETL